MAKYLTLSNGSLLVGLDDRAQVRDLYYPYVGLENHVSGASGSYAHRIGVWVDGTLKWLDDPSWKMSVGSATHKGEGTTHATHEELQVSLSILDTVYNEKNVFLRRVIVSNHASRSRTIKLFFAQQFRISEDRSGSTGFYDPRVHSVIHYKGHIYFLINARSQKRSFDDYSIGLFNMESHAGTHIDAEDGVLAKNPIEHGSVDSVIGTTLSLDSGMHEEVEYWLIAGASIEEVHTLNAMVEKKSPEHLRRTTRNFWRAWLNQAPIRKEMHLEPALRELYDQSLLIIKAHQDAHGGIIASSDSDLLQWGRDTYSYVWPRDAALSAHALLTAGYGDASRAFFSFALSVLDPKGYFMHKYRPDGTLGSSWHPWVRNGRPELPIQEDETAIIIFTLYEHFKKAHDLEFIESLYARLIAPAAEFMLSHIDLATKLPMESYDLWEEVFGTSTYTSSAVYGGLTAAAEFAKLLGKKKSETRYRTAALKMRDAIVQKLYDREHGIFYKYIRRSGEGFEYNNTPDISGLHGLLFFGVLDVTDTRITRMVHVVEETLKVKGEIGGYMRYTGDNYFRLNGSETPNAWIITTLWMAQYYIRVAHNKEELKRAYEVLRWVCRISLSTRVLPEQIHPHTGTPLSTTPLVWSHAEYVLTVHAYHDALKRFEQELCERICNDGMPNDR